MNNSNFSFRLLSLVFTVTLVSCGGGGSDNSTTALVNASNTPSETWNASVYPPSSQYQHYCANPRSGIDPFENTPYPDKAGSAMLEKLWLRSFSHETYLWYDEIPDQNPSTFDSIKAYFNSLKTSATTASGKQKDQFHFSESYEDYKKESQSGVSASYGVRWAFVNRTPPRVIRVAYIQENSPAAQAGLERGDTIAAIDGIDISATSSNELAAINNALIPQAGDSHTFTLLKNNGSINEVSLIAGDIASTPVRQHQVTTINDRRVGYLQFDQFISVGQRPLIEAFEVFAQKNVSELVLDLRYNGGGLINMASQLAYMIAGPTNTGAGPNNSGRVFSNTVYNDKRTAENRAMGFEYRVIDWEEQVYTDETLPSINLDRVYILTTNSTCSASELVINALRGIDVDVVMIGAPTCGKPYGFFPTANCGQVYYTVQFRSENAKGFGDYADGFLPVPSGQNNVELGLSNRVSGCTVGDDFSRALGSPDEALFAAALNYMNTGQCPQKTANRAIQGASMNAYGPAIDIPMHPLRNGAVTLPIKESH
ncbi:S41 family peptidase [Pseudoalteromonas sp. A25]|uniref:S41 family peptidase n=1 Tax=Pseudoalteromonas sp. A25 TaxID=116092 RepID=UPI001260816C|nr:S41 family peptidase [Pseudoalteromonas sp. A25]